MATCPGSYELPEDAEPMLAMYRRLYDLSDGRITPLIGDVLVQAGYDADYSLRPGKLVSPPSWEEAISYMPPVLTVRQPVTLDFGAVGKGYLVDLIGKLIQEAGSTSYCIDAGGDILVSGQEQRIGLENPTNAAEVVGIATVTTGSLCGSAGNRRSWEGFHHIIDPKRLQSPRQVQAVWTYADTALYADAATSALFFMEPEVVRHELSVECAVLYANGTAMISSGFPGHFFNG